MHIHLHAYIHTFIHTYIQRERKILPAEIKGTEKVFYHTHSHTHTHTYTYTYTHTYTHRSCQQRDRTQRKCSIIHTHTYTYTYTHTHTHTQILPAEGSATEKVFYQLDLVFTALFTLELGLGVGCRVWGIGFRDTGYRVQVKGYGV